VQPVLSIQRRVLTGSISNYAARFVSLAAWFVLTPLMLQRLGPTDYGLWVVVGSLVAYGWLLSGGIQSAVTRYVAAYWARGEVDMVSRVVATSLWCDTLLGIVAIALSAVLAPVVPAVFQIPGSEQGTTQWLVLIMGIGIGVTIPCETGAAALRGLHRYDLASLTDGTGTLLNVGAIFVVLLTGGGLLAIVSVGVPVVLLSQVLSMYLCRRLVPELHFGWHEVDPRMVRAIVGFSWPLLLVQTAALVQRKSDELVIGLFLPISVVTPYALAHRLSDLCRDLTRQFVGPFLPLASELHARSDMAGLRALFLTGTRLGLAIYLPLACSVTLLARPLLRLWVGPAYADNVALVAILSLAGVMLSTEWLASTVLQGMARHRLQGIVAISCAVGNVVVSAVLIGPFGLNGVAFGTLIAALVEYAIVMPYAARVIGVTLSECVRRILLPTVMPASGMAAVLYTVELSGEPDSWPALVGVAALGGIVFLGTYLLVGASRSERQLCWGLAVNTLRFAHGYGRRA
jgi:O-antigen/teichoic acid export membrane protein